MVSTAFGTPLSPTGSAHNLAGLERHLTPCLRTVWQTAMQAGAGRKADLDQSLSGVQVFKESRKTTASSLCLLELPLRNSTSAGKTSRHQGTLLSYQCVRAHTYLPAAPEKPGLKQNTLR